MLNAILGAVNIIPTPYLTERKQFRFPASKKGRIRKKWRKETRNWRTSASPKIIAMGNQLLAHPDTIELLKRKLSEKNIRVTDEPQLLNFDFLPNPLLDKMPMPKFEEPEFRYTSPLWRWRI